MRETTRALLYFTAGVTTVGLAHALYTLLRPPPTKPRNHASPIDLFSHLPDEDLRQLPYPPIDFIPGARDVSTPYGKIRLYEWGPVNASRKVLLLHGISGSCVVLLTLAETLVNNGCRVMLLDLFGRGWSGGPADLPYDGRLYASQIFMSLASSPVAWTGSSEGTESSKSKFSLIGYSLGGGIAADFTSYFPNLIEDLVLIAPGGLMTSNRRSQMLYSGVVPEGRMQRILRSRLLGPATTTGVLEPELTREESAGQPPKSETFLERIKGIDADAVVSWQLDYNPGFVPAFVSSIRYAPNTYRQERWRLIGRTIRDAKATRSGSFSNGNLLLILGGHDSIIKPTDIVPEATNVLCEDQLAVKVFEDAGHGVCMSHGADIAALLLERWAKKVSPAS